MGIYLNPGNAAFSEAVHSQIYVDKTELISYTNNVLATNQKNICVSRQGDLENHYSQYAGCLL